MQAIYFIRLRKFHLFPVCYMFNFYYERVLNFVKCFFRHLLRCLQFFSFILLIEGGNDYLHSCNKPKHTLVYYLSITGFDLMVFCSDFLCLCSWGISAIIFFSYKYLITFSCQDYVLIKQIRKYSLILLLKRFCNTILFLLKNVW